MELDYGRGEVPGSGAPGGVASVTGEEGIAAAGLAAAAAAAAAVAGSIMWQIFSWVRVISLLPPPCPLGTFVHRVSGSNPKYL